MMLVLGEFVTSYAIATPISDEPNDTLWTSLLQLIMSVHLLVDPPISMRTDPATGFQSLVNDSLLQEDYITLDISHSKNKNQNPVCAEHAIEEL